MHRYLERTYVVTPDGSGEPRKVVFQVSVPHRNADGDYVAALIVRDGPGDPRVVQFPSTDARNAISSALSLARSMILALHRRNKGRVTLNGKKSAEWM
jgi:hypothetical protein